MAINLANPINWRDPLNRGLAAHYCLLPGVAQGRQFRDIAHGYHGTFTGSPSIPTKLGGYRGAQGDGAINFNGAQYISVPHQTGINFTAMSAFVWMRPNYAGLSNLSALLSKQIDSGPEYPSFDLRYRAGTFAWEVAIGVGGTEYKAGSFVAVDDVWYHIGFTYDGETLAFYGDGAVDATNSTPSGNLTTVSANLSIGQNPTFPGRFFSGDISDVRLYNRGLSAEEVNRLYIQSRLGYPTALNWIRPTYGFIAAGGGGGTAFPWHYYQMMGS